MTTMGIKKTDMCLLLLAAETIPEHAKHMLRTWWGSIWTEEGEDEEESCDPSLSEVGGRSPDPSTSMAMTAYGHARPTRMGGRHPDASLFHRRGQRDKEAHQTADRK